jgi:uncharacterized membrane protein
MKQITWVYVGAVLLIIISVCGFGIGVMVAFANSDPSFQKLDSAFIFVPGCFGSLALLAGIGLLISAVRKTKSDTAQNVTLNVDLPADVNVEKMKCQSCGGVLGAKDITMVNGAPMVTCPYCETVYQLTEEPKW